MVVPPVVLPLVVPVVVVPEAFVPVPPLGRSPVVSRLASRLVSPVSIEVESGVDSRLSPPQELKSTAAPIRAAVAKDVHCFFIADK